MATFMLLPGAGGSGWIWHLVARELEARGHRAAPVDLPAGDDDAGLREYVDAVVGAVPAGAQDLAVVALSMGALTAPLVCERLPVRLLVLHNAMVPTPGETGGDWWQVTGQHEAMVEHARGIGLSEADLEDEAVLYGHDVPPELFAEEGERDSEQSGRPFADPWPLTRWPDVPTRVITGRDDRLFPRDFQHRLARERLGTVPDDVDGGHLAALSHPEQVAALLDRYAAEVLGAQAG
ncbi:alpha/beta fold hydrolase [Oceanitalea stevensii]|uniref:Alpha/beta hydrolase n=1 Tax=Oceanitalea stevensii TaxID=2763072 RepID=A0ABR8YYE8_9MICO|nr:alpha/beta hydrolase [Oceanitalea stevensii]MBD8061098.1 alpha/beta hydrolase [Oceanitalea stevensii]